MVTFGDRKEIAQMMLVILLMTMLGLAPLGGMPAELSCPHEERAVYEVIQLVPAIPEQPSQTRDNHPFFSQRVVVHYHEGQRVLLSSTPDGAGFLSGDDIFWMQGQPSGQVWERDFRDPARTQIIPIEPQWVTSLFTPGVNELEIRLQDRTPPVYGSSPWYLLLVSCVPQTVIAIPSPLPTDPPTITPTTQPTLVPSATPSATPSPTAIVTATPASGESVVFMPQIHTASPVEVVTAPRRWGLKLSRWMIAGSGLIMGLVLWRRQTKRRQNWVEGMISIEKNGQHVRQAALNQLHKTLVTIGPHGDIPLEIDPALSITRVQLRKQQGAAGQSEVVVEYLAAVEPGSAGKRANHQMGVVQTQKLRHGDAFTIGSYRLIYKHYR